MNCLVALPELVHELDNMHVLYLYHELLVMRNLGRRHELGWAHNLA
jgi:hypothetical protein